MKYIRMMSWYLLCVSPVVVSHVLRLDIAEHHVPHYHQLNTGDLTWLLEHNPSDGLVQGRGGQAPQVGPVALAGWQEVCWVNGFLESKGVSFLGNILENLTKLSKLRMFVANL